MLRADGGREAVGDAVRAVVVLLALARAPDVGRGGVDVPDLVSAVTAVVSILGSFMKVPTGSP